MKHINFTIRGLLLVGSLLTASIAVPFLAASAISLALALASAQPAIAAGTTCYVNDDASGSNNGTSWTNAYTSLQTAIADSCTEIWVAAGTYKPTASTDRTIKFNLKNGVGIYGGFASTETLVTQRDPALNVTTLSGDIGTISDASDNSYHVVNSSDLMDNTAVLDGFTITGGNADGGGSDDVGGGIYNSGDPSLSNLNLSDNSAVSAGGMFNTSGSPSLNNLTFSGNSVSSFGGGIYILSSNPSLTNVTFSGNSAGSRGGGMFIDDGSPSLTNVTFSLNAAFFSGGGIQNLGGGSPLLKNVILADSTNGDCVNYSGASLNAASTNNLIESTGANACGLANNYNGTSGNITGTNPALAALAANGGSTQTHALSTSSAALNAGTNTGCPSTDQRGVTRPQGDRCDIGAFEIPIATIIVNSSTDTVADDGSCTLREAITSANTNIASGAATNEYPAGTVLDMITFAADYTITLDSQLPAVTTAIIINGTGAANTIIQANAAPNTATYRIFVVRAAGNLTLNDLTIRNGRCNGACAISANDGGGIHNAGGAISASNVTFSGNTANNGGGIKNDSGSATLTNVTFSANAANNGGGMYNVGTYATLTNVTFSANSASNAAGGMYNDVSITMLTNVTFSANSASQGGGMYESYSFPELTNVIFSANTASSSGGGMYNINGSSPTLTNVTFSANSALINGGGMYNDSSSPMLTYVTFSANSANNGTGGGMYDFSSSNPMLTNVTFSANTANNGGGMYNDSSNPTLTNVTFSANSASFSGGMSNYNSSNPTLKNVIIANSAGGDCNNNYLSAFDAASSNNLIEDTGTNACGLVNGANGNIIGLDPNLGPLADNGGSTQTFALLINSPAIDKANYAVCAGITSQNGVTRPQGSNCDIGSFELPQSTFITKSVGTNDGWVLESSETSGVGGRMDSTATTFNLGDDLANKQYRAILHFDTSSLPDTAVITSATLRIKKDEQIGSNPFTILGGLKVDMRKPAFGMTTLALTDFKSAAGKTSAATFVATALSGWYSAVLNNGGALYINRTGSTQFRLRFTTDDNNDFGDDYMRFYSGNAGAANQPQLVIQYYVP